MKESKDFSTIKDFNKAYEEVRNDILARHNIKQGTKVRLKNAIMMLQNFNGNWIKVNSTKVDMMDRIKKYNNEGKFKLKAMV
jgi:hypothetical protein